MTEKLKFSNDSKWREFQGKQYLNCDDYTDEEMEVVANWDSATKEQRVAFCDKYGFNSSPGMYTRSPIIKVAEQMTDVEVCLEASFIPGGVVT
jgi:hypothetical protein